MWEKTVYGIPQPEYYLKSAYNKKKKMVTLVSEIAQKKKKSYDGILSYLRFYYKQEEHSINIAIWNCNDCLRVWH